MIPLWAAQAAMGKQAERIMQQELALYARAQKEDFEKYLAAETLEGLGKRLADLDARISAFQVRSRSTFARSKIM